MTRIGWRVTPRSRTIARPGVRLGAGGRYARTRTRPRRAWAPTISPTASVASSGAGDGGPAAGPGSLLFDDLEDDLSIGAGGRGIQDGADRLRRPALLADDTAQ